MTNNRFLRKGYLLRNFNLQMDLALEAHDLLRGARGGEIPGVSVEEDHSANAVIKTVTISDEAGSRAMQKPIGTYITISSEALKINNHAEHEQLAAVLTDALKQVIHFRSPLESVLVIGLGNWNAIADSLGPRIANKTMATRHLMGRVPQEILKGVRPVSAIAPGVLGITGIETAEIALGVIEKVKPDLIIAFDALAAGDVSRIGATIQISNTGINPGSGLGNHRTALNEETLGVPVIAVGVPTVVNAAVIAHNVLESFMEQLEHKPQLHQLWDQLPQPLLNNIVEQTLAPYTNQLTVTPKEIDDIMNNATNVIVKSLTTVLHPQMNEDFANCFV